MPVPLKTKRYVPVIFDTLTGKVVKLSNRDESELKALKALIAAQKARERRAKAR